MIIEVPITPTITELDTIEYFVRHIATNCIYSLYPLTPEEVIADPTGLTTDPYLGDYLRNKDRIELLEITRFVHSETDPRGMPIARRSWSQEVERKVLFSGVLNIAKGHPVTWKKAKVKA